MIGRTFLELPEDQDTFEEFVRDLFEKEYGFKLTILGKGPESQDGVDIIGEIPDSNWTDEFRKLNLDANATKRTLGIQAKVRTRTLSYFAIKSDHDKAQASSFDIAAFVVVTSATRNNTLVKNLRKERSKIPLYKYTYFKKDIQTLYLKYPDLWEKYHPLGQQLSQLTFLKDKVEFSAERFIELGIALVQKGQFDSAIHAAESAIEIIPEKPDTWILKCASYLSAGEPHKILSTVEEAVSTVGETPILVWFKAVAHLHLGDEDLAAKEFIRAYMMSKEPEEAIIVGYVSALILTGELAKAEYLAKMIVDQNPNDAFWTKQLAIIYLQQEKYDQAIQIFDFVKDKIAGTEHEGWYGYTLKAVGRLREGYPYIESSFQRLLSGSFPLGYKAALYAELGLLQLQMNELETAREYFDKAESMYENFVGLWIGKAALHLKEGDFRATEADLKRALEIDPQNVNVQARVARLRIRQDRIADAYESYRKAIMNSSNLTEKRTFEQTASIDFYFVAYRKQQEYYRTRDVSILESAKYAASCSLEFVENEGAQEILDSLKDVRAT